MLRHEYHLRMRVARRKIQARDRSPDRRWLVLFHSLPPKPDYLRVKVGRELRRLGAIALKNSVYVLPSTPHYREALLRVAQEILDLGGDAVACEAGLVAGLSDAAIEDRFREARNAEYTEVAASVRQLSIVLRASRVDGVARRAAVRKFGRLERRFTDIAARDPFAAAERETVAGLLSLVEDLAQGVARPARDDLRLAAPPRAAVWVTRAGVRVDRIASAWLVRRFIDRKARFKFVSGHGYRPARGEIRFDMAGAEFTHEDDRCTFEVLLQRFRLDDSALQSIAEIVHDLDFRDARFARPEGAGVGRLIAGIAAGTPDDGTRLTQGATIFDGLYQSFRKRSR